MKLSNYIKKLQKLEEKYGGDIDVVKFEQTLHWGKYEYTDVDNPKIVECQKLYMESLINNYKQLSCQCNLPRPNSFTGNCINCNKIIKPIIDKDVDKYTK